MSKKNMRYFLSAITLLLIITVLYFSKTISEKSEENTKTKSLSSDPVNDQKLPQKDRNESKPQQTAKFFIIPPTKYNRLTGSNIPAGLKELDKLSARITPGEYEPLSVLIQALTDLNDIKISWTDLTGNAGTIPSASLDVFIAKVWYQAGIKFNENKSKVLTQELLIKNDNLIKVDEAKQTNFLLCKKNDVESYVDVMTLTEDNQKGMTVEDSKTFLPFSLNQGYNKQIWFTIHVPDNAKAGNYTGQVTVSSDNSELISFPIQIEILPFKLDPPKLMYGIYYHGYVDNHLDRPMDFTNKNEDQYLIEMKDMKEHGIMYPTTYQILKNLDNDLKIRDKVGFPKDKLFTVGLKTGNPQNPEEIENLKKQVKAWIDEISRYGYQKLYVYGIDEAKGELLKSQRLAWKAVHEAGAKVFVAGYYETYDDVGDLLDAGIVQKQPMIEQAVKYHSKGNMVFSYSNPQSGEENPEIYRRNFGVLLWKSDYDGEMDYAYQKNYGEYLE